MPDTPRLHHLLSVIALLAALMGCTPTAPCEPSLVGRWYGEAPVAYTGGSARWLMDRRSDGMFTIVFRRYEGDRMVGEQTESGRWAFSHGLYTTLTQAQGDRRTDPRDKQFHDIYRVECINADELKFEHVETGLTFKSKRAASGFQLP